MSEWKNVELGDFLTFQRGFDIVKRNMKEEEGLYDVIFSSGFGGKHNEFKVKAPGVIVGRKGTLGSVFYSATDFWPTDTTLWIKDFHGNNPSFAYYFLKTLRFEQYDCGSANPTLNRNHIHTLEINVPESPQEQEDIAAVLSFLDRKIENLRKQNETLEQIAQTLFKHWFVDFECPNDDGKPYKSSGGEMVRSELGEIPVGWRVEPLDKVADFLNGLALQKYPAHSDNASLPVIKIREMKSGITKNTEKASSEIPNQYIIENGDVLFSWSGSLEIIIWCCGKGALNQHLFKVFSTKYPKWFYYFWNLEYLNHFRAIAKSKATTMGHIQRKHLSEVLCCIPNANQLQSMDLTMSPILEKNIQNKLQIQILTKTRDMLLPKLMSGQLRVGAG